MRNPVSRFAYASSDIRVPRSRFESGTDHKTTMSAGLLYPIFWTEYLPGDTFSIDTSSLVRMSTPIHPVMDNAFLDIYFFSVPNRIIWDHWKEFMGESPEDPYINPIEYQVPHLVFNKIASDGSPVPGYVIPPKSVADYLGIPSNVTPESFSALPVRAYCKVWNEWFRDENLQNAINFYTGDNDLTYAALQSVAASIETYPDVYWNGNAEGSDAYVENAARGGDLAPVNKYHDYFTSALKQPQKGDPVALPLNGFAPAYALDGLNFSQLGITPDQLYYQTLDSSENPFGSIFASPAGAVHSDNVLPSSGGVGVTPSNLVVNLGLSEAASKQLGVAYSTINDLRYAMQLQHLLQNDARYGTRYREIIKGHFQVDAPDGELQVPEFLGGKRISINMSQVLQTSSTDVTSPQGNTAAYSLTTDKFSSFTKSFTEHGILIGVACIRTEHTYAQGINKQFLRRNRYDYFFPELDNIPDQPIRNVEIYSPTSYDNNDVSLIQSFAAAKEIFGYQDPWAEYKYHPSRVSGEFRPTYPQSLDVWHYADDYLSQPYLSSEWIRETRSNIDRTLAVDSDVSDQFICDFYFNVAMTREMSLYSNGLGRTL